MWLLLFAFLAQADPSAEGLKALEARQYDAAIEQFTKAIAADASDYGAHFNLGLAYSLSGKDTLAIPEYRKVLDLKPGTYQAQINLGMSLHNTGQFAEAAEAYAAALKSKSDSAAAELGWGRALAKQGRREEAQPHYRRAAALDGANRDFLLELATLYEENHQAAEAIAIFKEFPENPGATERLGVLQLETGRITDAIAALESAVAKSPTAANRVALAQAYAKNQEPAKAEPLAALAVSGAPQDFELRMFYGRLLRDQRKFPQAAQQFQACAQIKPDAAPAWSELAGVLIMMEQFPQAISALDRVRALGAESSGHYFFRAITHDRLQQRKEAVEYYNKFLASDQGKNPDQEFQARQRLRILEKDLGKK